MAKLSPAPCDRCGYNGPSYYQPETHPCAVADERDVAAAVERLQSMSSEDLTHSAAYLRDHDINTVCDALAQAQQENAQLREQIGVYRRALSHNGLDY